MISLEVLEVVVDMEYDRDSAANKGGRGRGDASAELGSGGESDGALGSFTGCDRFAYIRTGFDARPYAEESTDCLYSERREVVEGVCNLY